MPFPDTENKRKSWVWFSSNNSIAKGKISILAIAEVPIAMAIYWWISSITAAPWVTLLCLMAAPVLLLRSPASIAEGLVLLVGYHSERNAPFRKINSYFILVVVYSYVMYMCFLAAQLSISQLSGFFLFLSFIFIASTGTAVALAGAGFGYYISIFVSSLMFLLVSWVWLTAEFSVALSVTGVIVLAVSLARAAWSFETADLPYSNINVADLPYMIQGLFFRSLGMRFLATIKHLREGIAEFPNNLRENLFVVDACHLPELLPQASNVNPAYTLKNFLTNPLMLLSMIGPAIYLTTLLYRWNIKASALIWWPIALVLSPALWLGEDGLRRNENMRSKTAFWSTWAMQSLMWMVLVTLVGWLSMPFLPSDIGAELPRWIQIFNAHYPPPTIGLRYIMLCLVACCLTGLLFSSYQVRAAYDKELAGAGDFDRLRHELQAQLLAKANTVRRLLKWNTAALVVAIWTYALWWSIMRWPVELENFVWAWIKPWL